MQSAGINRISKISRTYSAEISSIVNMDFMVNTCLLPLEYRHPHEVEAALHV